MSCRNSLKCCTVSSVGMGLYSENESESLQNKDIDFIIFVVKILKQLKVSYMFMQVS